MALTVEQVAAYVGENTADAAVLVAIGRVVNAVTATMQANYALPLTPTTEQLGAWELGILMKVARLWARRDSPGGVIAVGELGVVRVGRFDADIEEILAPFLVWNFG